MRKIFIVSAKILGLVKLLELIMSVVGFLVMIPVFFLPDASFESARFFMALLGLVGSLLSGIFVWILLFKAEWLASFLRIPEEEPPSYPLDGLLLIAIKILGLYLMVNSLPVFVHGYIQLRQMMVYDMNLNTCRLNLIVPALSIGLGVALILWTSKIAKLVLHEKQFQAQETDSSKVQRGL